MIRLGPYQRNKKYVFPNFQPLVSQSSGKSNKRSIEVVYYLFKEEEILERQYTVMFFNKKAVGLMGRLLAG